MTPSEFAALFPGQPFAIRWVEHGEHEKREFFWHVMFTSDYWTSDSWRAIYNHCPPSVPDGKGSTLEEALDDIVARTLQAAQRNTEYERERLLEAEQAERELKAKMRL